MTRRQAAFRKTSAEAMQQPAQERHVARAFHTVDAAHRRQPARCTGGLDNREAVNTLTCHWLSCRRVSAERWPPLSSRPQ